MTDPMYTLYASASAASAVPRSETAEGAHGTEARRRYVVREMLRLGRMSGGELVRLTVCPLPELCEEAWNTDGAWPHLVFAAHLELERRERL